MKLPADTKLLLKRRYDRQHREWLIDEGDRERWPLAIGLGVPTEQEALRQLATVQAWAAAWSGWSGPGEVVWVERAWRSLGQQRLPEKLVLAGPDDVAAWVGEAERWRRARLRFRDLSGRWPRLAERLTRYFDVLADYSDPDFQRLSELLEWLDSNPSSGLYPRQLPIAGLDTKWLERRQGMIGELVAAMRGVSGGTGNFYVQCGLKAPPARARLRLLDTGLRASVGGLGDVTAPWSDLSTLPIVPSRVIIVENVQTGLALPDLSSSVAVMGLGYNVADLARVPWLEQARVYYWGDLDTHGFAILSELRSQVPHAESLLMDEPTLLSHRELWVQEHRQHGADVLPGLKQFEQAVYTGLKQQQWGQNVRLEQERIAWGIVMAAIRALQ